MKKLLIAFLLLLSLVMLVSLVSCAPSVPEAELSIVAVNFAGYDFAAEIVGRDNSRVSLTFMSAGDAHSFNPTFSDLAKIESCDLFIYVGGESDTAVEALLKNARDVNTFRMIDCVSLLEAEGDHENEAHEGEEDHVHAYDEHVWTSPKNAILITEALCEAIMAIDPDYAADYRQNTDAYKESLRGLDRDFENLFSSVELPTLIFGDRFPFLYFATCYGVKYHAAFPGCSSASEPSPNTVALLIDQVKREGHTTVFYIESSNHAVADRIAAETGAETALFHSCHKVSSDEITEGVSYLSLMRMNYEAVKKALL